MSNEIPKENDTLETGERSPDNSLENEVNLELLEIKENKGAKTFIYRDPNQTKKRESLWIRLWGEKSTSVE